VANVNISDRAGQRVTAFATIIVGFVPSVFYSFYNETHLIGNGTTGSTYAIGLVEECFQKWNPSRFQSDLNIFDSKFGLSSTTVNFQYSPKGNGCSMNPSDFAPDEVALDIEWAHVAAPGATIYVCFDTLDTISGLEACDQLFYQLRLPLSSGGDNTMIVSNSWKRCAVGISHNYTCVNGQDPYGGNWSAAELAGMNVFASSGDIMAYAHGKPDNCSTANYGASNPYGIAVGGTTIGGVGSSGSYGSETVWQNGGSVQECVIGHVHGAPVYSEGTAGETSGTNSYYPVSLFPILDYQQTLLGNSNRYFPDVSMVGDPSTGVPIVFDGGWELVGGTSVGSPIWAGILDVLFQAGALPLATFAAQFLYNHPLCFHEIMNSGGSRDGLGTPDVGCLAGV
jgi:subtilase family serine protease